MRRFEQVDVFTNVPLYGNPLAVVIDGEGLNDDDMQRFATWTNLSETTFLLPPTDPDADYRVRIFTPTTELPFAGHPTLGSCHVWLGAGGTPARDDVIVQECGVGLVEIRRENSQLAFAAPPLIRSGTVEPAVLSRVVAALGIAAGDVVDAAWVDNGPGWVGVELADAAAVLGLTPGHLDGLDIGVIGPHTSPGSDEPQFEVRAFFPVGGETREDPVTGSLNASLAQWMIGKGRAKAPYVVGQGTALGRRGRVSVTQPVAGGPIWIGGDTITVVAGTAAI